MSDHVTEFTTPMMQQYLRIKAQYADCILLYRLGDFYEMFLEDAEEGAEILDITLTARARGKDGRVPMAGIPYHALDNYLYKLVQAGKKVAICEQMTEPGKGLVEREVIRIVTPGTVLDEKNLSKNEHLYILFLTFGRQILAAAAADLGTGQVLVSEIKLEIPRGQGKTQKATEFFDQDSYLLSLKEPLQQLESLLHPAEVVVSPTVKETKALYQLLEHNFTYLTSNPDWPTEPDSWLETLRQQFGTASITHPLLRSDLTIQAAAALIQYLESTQKMVLPHLQLPKTLITPSHLEMDPSTISNLELFSSLSSTERHPQINTLIQLIDHTKTAMGGRLLRNWLRQPLNDIVTIEQRLDKVEFFLTHPDQLKQLQQHLQQIIDIERLLSRIVLKQGSPKDLRSLVDMLSELWAVRRTIEETGSPLFHQYIEEITDTLLELRHTLDSYLLDDPAFDPRQGNVIKTGIDDQLDELRQVVQHSQEWIAELELTERQKTGINTLKIRFNQVFGFYIEVSKANLSLVPDYFLRKQTLVNAERFITPELKKHEEIILGAKEKTDKIEYDLFLRLVERVKDNVATIQAAANAVATLDCLANFAEISLLRHYTRPSLNTTGELEIIDGRHPVVEEILQHRFVPNSVTLDPARRQLLLLTGPNMAGKSVLMRQVALIVILTHIGCYVPAKQANISLTDRVFVRSGAADMITAGLSTFMVEMVETAQILQSATERSVVIMDEIGRGTSTYDGISIAWAVAESLIKSPRGPKTLFATHYHELQTLADSFPDKIRNAHMAVTEQDQQPVFLYTLKEGGASHSYGLAVAQLAGIPAEVTKRATELLSQLERSQQYVEKNQAVPVRKSSQKARSPSETSPAPHLQAELFLSELRQLSLDQLTPLEALNLLALWKKRAETR
ncbi:DNA mismatch repair protein MutS [Patescibacteria group bacterium]|nr:DNA mismatch repair protein MutS [Patescibacteria group bacterium]